MRCKHPKNRKVHGGPPQAAWCVPRERSPRRGCPRPTQNTLPQRAPAGPRDAERRGAGRRGAGPRGPEGVGTQTARHRSQAPSMVHCNWSCLTIARRGSGGPSVGSACRAQGRHPAGQPTVTGGLSTPADCTLSPPRLLLTSSTLSLQSVRSRRVGPPRRGVARLARLGVRTTAWGLYYRMHRLELWPVVPLPAPGHPGHPGPAAR